MKKIIITMFLFSLSVNNRYADSLDNALNAQSRALNAGTVYGGVNTAAGRVGKASSGSHPTFLPHVLLRESLKARPIFELFSQYPLQNFP